MKAQAITAKSLLKILAQAEKSTKLGRITQLYVERKRINEGMGKLREKKKAVAEEIRELTVTKEPEQFFFRF